MKITDGILRSLGAKAVAVHRWKLPCGFIVHKDRGRWFFEDNIPVRTVADIMRQCWFEGLSSGKKAIQDDIKQLLGIEDAKSDRG